jgi:hypothetical protein
LSNHGGLGVGREGIGATGPLRFAGRGRGRRVALAGYRRDLLLRNQLGVQLAHGMQLAGTAFVVDFHVARAFGQAGQAHARATHQQLKRTV